MALNINPDTDDPFYRYKMPPLVAKKEGRGNGKKTILPNVMELGAALSRPPTYITKYFGCVLGAGTSWNIEQERYQVNGYYEQPDLQDKLFGFIREFVLCPSCGNPETVLSIREQKVYSKCKACGTQGFLKNQGHKLNNFILNNPPKKEKGDKKKKAGDKGSQAEGGEIDTEFDMPPPENEPEMDDDDWAEDTSAEAVAVRHKQMVDGLGDGIKESLVDVNSLSEEKRLEMFHTFLQDQKKDTGSWKAIIAEGERLKFPKFCIMALSDWAFTSDMVEEVKTFKKLFLPFLEGFGKKARKELIGGVEMSIGAHSLVDATADILKELYKKGYLDEECLEAWKEKGPTKKYVKKKMSTKIHENASGFFEWLKNHGDEENESDESDDDDDLADDDVDDDLEIGFSESMDINNETITNGHAPAAKEEEEDSDFDIDDI